MESWEKKLTIEKPKRVRWHRFMGVKLPPNTWNVQRPSIYGNPFKMKDCNCDPALSPDHTHTREEALVLFRYLAERQLVTHYRPNFITELRGYDLACACPLDEPCHADILLELANRP